MADDPRRPPSGVMKPGASSAPSSLPPPRPPRRTSAAVPPPMPPRRASQRPPAQPVYDIPEVATVQRAPRIAVPESWDARTAARAGFPVAPAPRRRSGAVMALGVLAVLSVTAAAAAFAWRLTTPPKPPPPAEAAAPSAAAPPAEKPAPPPSTPATAQPKADPAPIAVVRAPKPTDVAGCYAGLLAGEPFGERQPNLDGTCEMRSAYGGMLALKTEIVRTGGAAAVTPAMAEWSRLGWYESAAYAIMRAHCCPADAPALTIPSLFERCRMEPALAYLANGLDDELAMREAINAYGEAATCIAGRGGGGTFGQRGIPSGGEVIYLERVLERLAKARGGG